jgi:hypothetical protein
MTSTAYAFDVTTCGQILPTNETGMLQVDLACPAGVGVHLKDRATLDLNGHAIAAPAGPAIACEGRRCNITSTGASPGDVSGSPVADCITMGPRGRMVLSNLDVHDCRTCIETNLLGAHLYGASLSASAVTVDGCAGPGIDARKVRAFGVSVTNASEIALWAEMVLEGKGIDASGNAGIGIFAVRIKADNVVAGDNGSYGVEAFKTIRIRGGEMLGNGLFDVASERAKLEGVTCGHSHKFGGAPNETLGVCTND